MTTYRENPIVVTAIQYNGSNQAEIVAFLNDPENYPVTEENGNLIIRSPYAVMTLAPTDWLISRDKFFPLTNALFTTYYTPNT